jgi:Zn-dependent protease with chaperone function
VDVAASGSIPRPKAEAPAADPPVVGGLGLATRLLGLRAIRLAHAVGTHAGAGVLLALGGFVPVARRWLADDLAGGWAGVVEALGGVPVRIESGDPDADFGPVLSRGDAPRLFAELADVARRLGARPPGQVRLAFLPCCGVVAWGRSRALLLGLPLLHVLTVEELRAVLAHELAHLARGDATASARSTRFVETLAGDLDRARPAPWSPLRWLARACRAWGERLAAPIARSQEARADRAAAAIAGGAPAASSLVKVALVQPLFREALDRYDPELPGPPNLFAFFREFWSRIPEPLHAAMRHHLLTDPNAPAGPAHPPLFDRVAAAQSYPARPAPEPPGQPASIAVCDLEALEQMLHDHLFATRRRVEPSLFHRAGS